MKHHFCLLFLLLCTVCLAAPSNDAADERRRLLDESSRQTQQYRESDWLDTEQARGEAEENDGYIMIDGAVYQSAIRRKSWKARFTTPSIRGSGTKCGSSPPATQNCRNTNPR